MGNQPVQAPKIAYVLGTFPALTETFVRREIAALRCRGLDIVVVAIRRPDKMWESDEADALLASGPCMYARPDGLLRHALANVSYLLRHPRRYLRGFSVFLAQSPTLTPRETLQLIYHFFVGVGFARDLRRLGFSHVHSHFTNPTNVALAMHLTADMAFSFTAHASNDLFVRPLLLPEKTACARLVVAVCEYSRRYLDSVTGFRFSEKIHRIYNGIGLDEPMRLPRGAPGSPQARHTEVHEARIVSVGSLLPPKGHATLIQVCARLKAAGENFTCRIIGQGRDRETLERLITTHRLQGCVELLGALPLDQVYAELRTADVFVLLAEIGPSGYRDGFPTVILEAMAAELPVLSTTLSGIPEMVLDGVTGILVPERDIEAASLALQRLLKSEGLRRTMGRAGRERLSQFFDLDNSADQLASLLASNASPALARA